MPKRYNQADLDAHTTQEDLYLLISGKVYNATPFLPEHPGGFEILVQQAGKDATESFEDVGHSYEAQVALEGLYIGDFGEGMDPEPDMLAGPMAKMAISSGPVYTQADLDAHKDADDLYLLIDGKVYDATSFLPAHPGGFELLVEQAGKDATDAFEAVGHSYEAYETLKGLLLGDFGTSSMGSAPKAAMAPAAAPMSAPAMAAPEPMASTAVPPMKVTVYTQSDLDAHNKEKDLYLLINGKVYDATPFLPEHPGGFEILLTQAGKDATEAFDDVGHSFEATETLKGLLLGDFA